MTLSPSKPNGVCPIQICAVECLVSLGTSILVLIVMPQFDVLTNLFISGGVCIVSAILQIVYRLQRETWKIIFPICSLTLTLTGNPLYIYSSSVQSLSACLSMSLLVITIYKRIRFKKWVSIMNSTFTDSRWICRVSQFFTPWTLAVLN